MGKIGHKPTNFKWMKFEKNGQGCDICISHKGNQDGYIRKRWTDSVCEMFHRFIYRGVHNLDSIPKDMTLHHLCGNRACCNPTHLVLMTKSDHATYHNNNRDFSLGEWKRNN